MYKQLHRLEYPNGLGFKSTNYSNAERLNASFACFTHKSVSLQHILPLCRSYTKGAKNNLLVQAQPLFLNNMLPEKSIDGKKSMGLHV